MRTKPSPESPNAGPGITATFLLYSSCLQNSSLGSPDFGWTGTHRKRPGVQKQVRPRLFSALTSQRRRKSYSLRMDSMSASQFFSAVTAAYWLVVGAHMMLRLMDLRHHLDDGLGPAGIAQAPASHGMRLGKPLTTMVRSAMPGRLAMLTCRVWP